jgi:hypothetical protein
MSSPRVQFTLRGLMLAVAASAGLLACVVWDANRQRPPAASSAPSRIYDAALRQVPNLIVTSVRPEVFNGVRAWEVIGTAQDGTVWMIDVLDSGEVVMWEPIEHHPLPSVMVPDADS